MLVISSLNVLDSSLFRSVILGITDVVTKGELFAKKKLFVSLDPYDRTDNLLSRRGHMSLIS